MPIQPAFGNKDLNPQEVRKNQLISSRLSSIYERWGYEEVSPPKVERLETLTACGGISNKEIVKLVADDPIGLRPDMTASIARAASTRLAYKDRPLRLWTSGTIFKSKEDCDGKFVIEEGLQSGVELIGISDMAAEIELLYLLLDSMNQLEICSNQNPILLIGHQSILKLILSGISNDYKNKIQKYLTNYDLVETEDLDIDIEIKNKLLKVLKIRGNPSDVLDKLVNIYGSNTLFDELRRLFLIIEPISKKYGVSIQLDPTYQPHFKLYNGLIFQLICQTDYAPKVIARGGRYDDLVNSFTTSIENETGAGFSFSIDKIRELKLKVEYDDKKVARTLIAFSKSKRYEDALEKQLEIHRKGSMAMVELKPCDTKKEAEFLVNKRGFDKLVWIS
ncbi:MULTISPECIES: ATP phosphoribosyltransferase regulatory subunit [Prochlorococcus]|uniref:ATP phosphoribosyltransferase regulatory subunit n=1 Tax=Prochlorococcus marinus (strain SARG / CCMP1375 / SS120) TaxID=167539 RepID=HISZ_PROMA|nr:MULTISPECIES: ATP phosphoribosyltransferase regulatory subunit [Prochlorococcus]Q7VC06.1 RecName: Full=ATP phosphoribosyltransferase regulatory subunit [Prochlorococcus marinus subsp. marinus str. CCMP1375]AAP99980.1 ATP phosphoribosyltransferase [Prochlorococcus marinus subsp. marinus str. CCMP1375]KGG13778.1 ATP phosphoribosyltransferase regulatory subunit [Prochlorococcus marinus str. LG]KGG18913.1 ATP phosphoribosyltransferase regulatory subunit [Prochlorococcus marinus str. SS2]KGG2354